MPDLKRLRFALRHVDLDYVEHAPKKQIFTTEIAGTPEQVWHELADDAATWSEWFPQVRYGAYVGGGTPGIDSRRVVHLQGGAKFQETILAFEPGARYTWRVDACSLPVFAALVEDWRVEPAGDGSHSTVTWTFAYEPRLLFKLAEPLAPKAMGRSFKQATTNLEARVAAL